MKPSLKTRQFTVFLVDMAVLYFTLYAVLAMRAGEFPGWDSWKVHAYYFSFAFVGWVVVFYVLRLYSLDVSFDSLKFAARLAVAVGMSGLITALYFYLAPKVPIAPKTILLLFIVFSYICLWLWRILYSAVMRFSPIRNRIAFVGYSPETGELINAISERSHLGYDLAFVYDESRKPAQFPGLTTIGTPGELKAFVTGTGVAIVVLADHVALSVDARRVLFDLIETGTRFERLQNFYEMLMRRVPLGVISEAWFLENIDLRSKRFYIVIKRGLDISLAILGMVVAAPLWPLVALIIKLESRGPVLFKQVRLGRHDKPFTIYKFRSMRTEGNDFAPTGERDSRITGLGSFLRKTRLDEIPQMLNILKGEMSFVGPRPERPELAAELSKAIPFYRQRHMVKPGVTGWDQVSGEYHSPSFEDTYKKLQYDLYYVKNMSVLMDVSIFFKTIMTVISRSGR